MFLIILLAFACRKKENDIPQVSISEPNNLSSFAYQDYIYLKGDVKDSDEIRQIKVELLNLNLQSTGIQNTKAINELNPDFNIALELDDIHLETGNYYVKVTALDEEGFGSEYLEISYQGAQRVRTGIIGVFESGGSYSIDTLNTSSSNWTSLISSNDSILDFEVQSYDQYIFWSTSNSDLSSRGLSVTNPDWNKAGTFMSPSYDFQFLELVGKVENLGSTRSDGSVQIYNSFGGGILLYPPFQNGFKTLTFLKTDNSMFSFVENFQTLERKMIHYSSVGIVSQNYNPQMDVRRIYKVDNNELLLFGNENATAKLKVHYISGGGFYEPYSISGKSFIAVEELSNQFFLLLLSDGLYTYNYSNNNLLQISASDYSGIAYDEVNNVIAAFTSNQLDILNVNGQLLQSYPTAKNLYGLQFRYNK